MGNQKQKWTQEEEDALVNGVKKHGPGKWKNILKDPEFAPCLTQRSNIDLKDKWRNMNVNSTATGSKEKIRVPKPKTAVAAAAAPVANVQSSAPAVPLHQVKPSDNVAEEPSQSAQDVKTASLYNALIFEALSKSTHSDGSDAGALLNYIEERHEVPPNFKRYLTSRLRRLVSQGKLEKVQNNYKLIKDTLGTKALTPKQKDIRPQQSPTSIEIVKSAAEAAYLVVEAENKSYLAAEAVKEMEKFLMKAEEADSMLQLAKEIFEKCSRGEVPILA